MTEHAVVAVSPSERRLIAITVAVATIVIVLDMNIATIALPHMQGSLSASQDQIIWVMTAFFVSQALTTACGGWIAGRIGRRRLYLISLAGLAVTALLAAQSSSLAEIILWRTLQGALGAPIIPLSQAILLDIYPRERHGQALSIWGIGVMVAPVMGPVVGGWLTEVASWHAIYLLGAPFCVLAFIGTWIWVPASERDRTRRFDWFGFGAFALGLAALQLVLDRGEIKGWFDSSEIVVYAALAALGFYLFVVHSLTTDHPFLPPGLLGDRNLTLGLIFVFLVGMIVFATNVILPLFLQNLAGYPVMTAGFIMAPRGLGSVIGLLIAGRLVNKVDPRLLVLCGFAAIAFSSWELSIMTMDVSMGHFIVASVFNGAGTGLVWVPLTTLAFATLAPQHRNEAANLWALVRTYGSAVGISILSNLQSSTRTEVGARLTEHVHPYNPMMNEPYLPDLWSLDELTGLARLAREIARQGAMMGYIADFTFLLGIIFATLPFLVFLRVRPMRTR